MNLKTNDSIEENQSAFIEQYLSQVYPSLRCHIALCLIPSDNQPVQHRFTTVGHLGKFIKYCRFLNASGWNIYITPSVLKPGTHNRRKASFLPHQKVIYVDCDQKSCLEAIKNRYPYPTLVVQTSKGHHQVYWRLSQPLAVADQEHLMRAIAKDIGADRAATDVSRVLRLPGFWNRKPHRQNTVDIVFSRDQAIAYQSLSMIPSCQARDKLQSTHTSTQQQRRVLECAGDRLNRQHDKELSESERDWYLIHRWLALGISKEECIRRLISRRQGQKRDVVYYAFYSVEKAMRIREGIGE